MCCGRRHGGLAAIVEHRDATDEQRRVREVNSSIYVFRADSLWPVLDRLTPHNAQGELYLTDSVAILVEDGERVAVHKGGDPVETEGVNTRVELAAAAAALRDRINEAHMLAGVTIVDPESTWIDAEAMLEPDAVVHPFTVIRGASRIAARAEVGPHAVVVDSTVGEDALVGPFCYLRPGTVLGRRREGRYLRRAEELAHRRTDEGAPSHVPRRRRCRAGHEHRGREHHGQPGAHAREGADDHRS